MNSGELRSSFLRFFESRQHRSVPSSSLVPEDDPTLLFTNAGMNQFKNVFLGRERRDYTRATSSQKCMRVSGKHNDLENVGPSLRHHTFFEMLGNFSFGDYFKHDAIEFAWTLLTDVWGLKPEQLYVTVFGGEAEIPWDEEAYARWQTFVPESRIEKLGLADNFWSMGDTGPCGRCSELHFFRGHEIPCPEPVCLGIACNCDRFIEIWNNVFMEFDRQADGTLNPLPARSIDTGMGLERIAAVVKGSLSNYDTDLFQPLLQAMGEMAGKPYGADPLSDVSMRVVADHIRAMTFLISDGVVPSNEWRGYVLRKIMRRAMRHGKRLGVMKPFLHDLVDVVVNTMSDAYPQLRSNHEAIGSVVHAEEDRFDAVLTSGLPRLEEVLERASAAGTAVPGDDMFRLYDSFGLPIDFIEDLAGERRLAVDREGFDRAMEAQRRRARASNAFDTQKAQDFQYASDESKRQVESAADVFEGYATTHLTGVPVLALFDHDRKQVNELWDGEAGYAVLARTPFYLEAGGQVSDSGSIYSEAGGGEAIVEGLVRTGPGTPRAHRIRMSTGMLHTSGHVIAAVDEAIRDATRRNHTATHLLHAALRQVLGGHVKQAGSLVAPERLRFDFVHFAPLSREDLANIERIVNEQIYRNTPVQTEVRATQEAMASGAMALFGEKYGDRVRVVSIPGFSVELCGGTHARATGDIGFFAIQQETGVAAGVRRIEAVTGEGAVRLYQQQRATLDGVLSALHVPDAQAIEALERLQAETKRLTREVGALKMKAAVGGSGDAQDEPMDVAGVKLVARRAHGLDKVALRTLSDTLRDRIKSGVVILASEADGKVSMTVAVTKDLVGRVSAGQLVKQLAPIVGGGGGGRPDFAEAGGKDPSGIDEMLTQSRAILEKTLS